LHTAQAPRPAGPVPEPGLVECRAPHRVLSS